MSSGAAVTPEEFNRYDQEFFPQPGQSAEVIKQKRQARQVAIEAMKKATGPVYSPPNIPQDQRRLDRSRQRRPCARETLMPIFEIEVGGRKLEVDAPDMQSAVSAVGAAPAATPDPYKQEAQAEYQRLKSQGIPVEQGLTRRIAQGMTLGAADELLAGALTPFEMAKRGTWDPREGYKHAKAMQDVAMEDARNTQGIPGHIAEVAGGVGTGIGAARAGLNAGSSRRWRCRPRRCFVRRGRCLWWRARLPRRARW